MWREENLKTSSCVLQCIPKYTHSKLCPRHIRPIEEIITSSPALPYITDLWWCTQQNGKVSNLVNGPIPWNEPPQDWKVFWIHFWGQDQNLWNGPPQDLTSGGKFWNSTFSCTVQWCMQICHKTFSHHVRAIWKC